MANLAVALARTGRKVALVDLDLRRPYQDKFFDLEGRPGVTDVVVGHAELADALAPIVVTGAHGLPATGNGNGGPVVDGILHVLPVGARPPDPAEFLATGALQSLLTKLAKRHDLILIDSAPLLPVSDSQILGARVDAIVILAKASALRRPVLKAWAAHYGR